MEIQHCATAADAQDVSQTQLRFAVVSSTLLSYTIGMKTAISLPDDLFRAAESHAKRQKKSRSQLYAEALAEYLVRHAPDEVTEAMNRVIEKLGEYRTEPFLATTARRVLESTEW